MRDTQRQRLFNIAPPFFVRKSGTTINQIQGDIGDDALCHPERFDGLAGIVCPVHPPKVFFKKALNTNAEPVDAQRLPFLHPLISDIVRIRLQRDLRITRPAEAMPESSQDIGQFARFKQAWRTPSKINAVGYTRDILYPPDLFQ